MRHQERTASRLPRSLEVNLVRKRPKSPLYRKPWKEELSRSVVKVATMQQKNTCHDSLFFQKEETSSMANSSPPTGAPNAEAIPVLQMQMRASIC